MRNFTNVSLLIFFANLAYISFGPRLTVIAGSKCPLFKTGNLFFGQRISIKTGATYPFGDGSV